MNPTSVWVLFSGCECRYHHPNPKIQPQSPARWLCVYVPFYQVDCCNCLLQLLATCDTSQCWWSQLSSKVVGLNRYSDRKVDCHIHRCTQSWECLSWSLSWPNMQLIIAILVAIEHAILFYSFTRYHHDRAIVHRDLHCEWTLIICALSCNQNCDSSWWSSSRMKVDPSHTLVRSNYCVCATSSQSKLLVREHCHGRIIPTQ